MSDHIAIIAWPSEAEVEALSTACMSRMEVVHSGWPFVAKERGLNYGELFNAVQDVLWRIARDISREMPLTVALDHQASATFTAGNGIVRLIGQCSIGDQYGNPLFDFSSLANPPPEPATPKPYKRPTPPGWVLRQRGEG